MDKVKQYFDLAKEQKMPISLDEANKMIDDFNGFPKGKFSINIKKLIIMVSTIVSILTAGFFVMNSFNTEKPTEVQITKETSPKQIVVLDNNEQHIQQEEQENERLIISEPQEISVKKEKNNINKSYPVESSFINSYNYFSHSLNAEKSSIVDTVITKEFDITDAKGIAMENSFSNVDIKTWDEPRIKVVASYIITAKDKNKRIFLDNLDLILYKNKINNIVINNNFFYFSQTLVNSTIELHNGENKYYKRKRISRFEFDNEVESNIDKVVTNYVVYVPKDFNLDIRTIGDVNIPATKGEVYVYITGGTLTAEKINNNFKIDLAYADANIASFHEGEFNIYKGELSFNSCQSLYLDCQKAKIKGSMVKDSLTIDAHKSIIKIKEIGVASIDADHSQLEFEKMKSLNLFGHKDSVAINNIDEFNSDIDHSQFYFGTVGKMILGNHKSTYLIQKADTIIADLTQGLLNIESLNYLYLGDVHKQEIKIRKLNTLKGSATHSIINIDLLKNSVDFEDFKSIIKIGIADNKFDKIKLDIRKTDITINKKSSFELPYKFYVNGAKIEMAEKIVPSLTKSCEGGWATFKSENFEKTKLGKIDITCFKSVIKIKP